MAIGNIKMSEEQLRQNIGMSANFLVSLLKKEYKILRGSTLKLPWVRPIRYLK